MNLPLTLHLAGAALSAGLVIVAVVSIVMRRARLYRPLARSLVVLSVVQIASGAVLAYSTGGSILAFCARLSAYLSVIMLTQLALWAAAKRAAVKHGVAVSVDK